MNKTWLRSVLLALTVGAVLSGAAPAHAGNFVVDPVVAVLTPREPSALLLMSNTGIGSLRFELSATEWSQGPEGQIILAPTDDMIFFPQLFALDAGAKRKIRVGMVAPAEEMEKSYRLLVAQLPSPVSERPANSGIELVTRLSIPVFVEPVLIRKGGALASVGATGRKVSFQVTNDGNVHLVVEKATVTGLNGAGTPAFTREAKGWYVLAGQSSNFNLELTADECAKAQTIVVAIKTDSKTFDQRVAGTPGSCMVR
jgi:fimbrial chaperone protein